MQKLPGILALALLALPAFADPLTPPAGGAISPNAVLTLSGSLTNGNCIRAAGAAKIQDAGAPCGSGTGTVTTTGSPASGEIAQFSGATSITTAAATGTGSVVRATAPAVTGITTDTIVASGLSTAAGYSPTSSTASGNRLFLPTTNTLGFAVNSLEAVRINPGSSPTRKLEFTPGSSTYAIAVTGGAGGANLVIDAAAPGGITSSSNWSTSGAYTATQAVSGGRFVATASTIATNGLYLPTTNTLGFSTNSGLRMSIDATGVVTMPAYGAGNAVFDGAGVISSSSDARLKLQMGRFERTVDGFVPMRYRWKFAPHDTEGIYAGFIAQNVQETCPECVGVGPDGYLTLQDRAVLAAAVNTINRQSGEIKTLKYVAGFVLVMLTGCGLALLLLSRRD